MELNRLTELAHQIGFSHIGPVTIDALITYPEVREMCASGRCTAYGHNWSCPPALMNLDDSQALMRQYREGLLLQTTGNLSDDFDHETMRQTERLHKAHFETLARQARMLEPSCLILSSGTCTRCRKCTYPSSPCRYPAQRYSSMEAMGLLISEVCEKSGLSYNYGRQTITYTACILIGKDSADTSSIS